MINIMITIDDISTHGSGSQSSPPKLTTNCGLVLKGTKHPPFFASSAPGGPGAVATPGGWKGGRGMKGWDHKLEADWNP